MANASFIQGLVPRMHRNGEPYSGSNRVYATLATDATPLGIGDPVVITGDTDPVSGVPIVTRATAGAGNYISGVMTGISVRGLTSQSLIPYRQASTATFIEVADNPDLVFEIQANGVVATTGVTKNANLVFASLNPASGLSGAQLDETTIGTGATLQLKGLRMVNRPDNLPGAVGGAFTKLEVMINLHTQRNTTAI